MIFVLFVYFLLLGARIGQVKILYPVTPFVNNGQGLYPTQLPIFANQNNQYNPYNQNMNNYPSGNLQNGFNQPHQMNDMPPVYNSSYERNTSPSRSQPPAPQNQDFPQPVISESVFNTLAKTTNNKPATSN